MIYEENIETFDECLVFMFFLSLSHSEFEY